MSHQEVEFVAEPVGVLNRDASADSLSVNTGEAFEDWLSVVSEPSSQQIAKAPADIASISPSEIAFEGTLRVNGYVAGVIRSPAGRLIVDATGVVDADIFVESASISGCVRGDISASHKVELSGSARVIGDIETIHLSIEPGATFEGRCVFLQSPDAAINS